MVADSITLSAENIHRIREIINSIEVHGMRYDEQSMKKCHL
jgi:hypothetical protein